MFGYTWPKSKETWLRPNSPPERKQTNKNTNKKTKQNKHTNKQTNTCMKAIIHHSTDLWMLVVRLCHIHVGLRVGRTIIMRQIMPYIVCQSWLYELFFEQVLCHHSYICMPRLGGNNQWWAPPKGNKFSSLKDPNSGQTTSQTSSGSCIWALHPLLWPNSPMHWRQLWTSRLWGWSPPLDLRSWAGVFQTI